MFPAVALLGLIVYAALAKGAGEPDRPQAFNATCAVLPNAGWPRAGACRSEDMPAPGFENRFRLLFDFDVPPAAALDTPFTVQATHWGGMIYSTPDWGQVFVLPRSPEIRGFMRQAAPAYETLPQTIWARPVVAPWRSELYIEHPGREAR